MPKRRGGGVEPTFMSAVIGALNGLEDPYQWGYQPTLPSFEGAEDFAPDTTNPAANPPTEEIVEGDGGATTRSGLMELARAQVGAPYVWADMNPVGPDGGPGAGFDCSGFTQYILGQLGIETTHNSAAQQDQFPFVSRQDLQPGDLVFYHYTDRNGTGNTADHVEIYIGNGKTIGSSGGGVMVRDVNWDAFVGGGDTGAVSQAGGGKTHPNRGGDNRSQRPAQMSKGPVFAALAGIEGQPYEMASVITTLMAPEQADRPRGRPPTFTGKGSSIKSQLYYGFLKAGRPDLARMVKTKDFNTWINQESGWDPYVTSQYFAGHGVNYGLFQFWEGHDWTQQFVDGGEWTATPFEQAKLAAKFFPDLTPDDIHRYADQIRNGTYHGWPD